MTYETIAGPLSRVLCCLVPIAWLPALAVYVGVRKLTRRDKQGRKL